MSGICDNTAAHQALDELLTGELDDSKRKLLREHLASCASCAEQYDRITRAQAQLEKSSSGLPRERMAELEQRLLKRTAQADAAATPTPKGARFWRWLLPTAGLITAAAVGIIVLLPRTIEQPGDGYQARGGEASTWGVRAFCVAPGTPPQVKSEAGPGGTLSCPAGMAVTFAYTAPRAAKLSLVAPGPGGEPLEFIAEGDPLSNVAAGTDVPLDFSTPVGPRWLTGPLPVTARFTDPQSGALLGESTVTLKP